MASSLVHSPHGQGGIVYRSHAQQLVVDDTALLQAYPNAGLYAPGAYATIYDLITVSIPDDSRCDFLAGKMSRFLTIGAGRINEHLGNRGWHVPLVWWSETVVWANCELAYILLARQRGVNTEADAQNFLTREQNVVKWLESARDGEITPDQRESTANLGSQAFKYIGQPSRGWDRIPGSSSRGRW